eukprot:m.214475 g.214475  ORF g.214475 m.214475 type:complete len:264 (+) comp54056_c0_seq20:195-986(+)
MGQANSKKNLKAEAKIKQDDIHDLLVAVQNDQMEQCQQIVLACGKNIITTPCGHFPYDGWIPLHVAAIRDRVEILAWFLRQHIDCNLLNCDGCTALMYAVSNDSVASVRLLVQAGAGLSAKDKHGRTVYEYFPGHGSSEIMAMLKEQERYLASQQNVKAAVHENAHPVTQEAEELPLPKTDGSASPTNILEYEEPKVALSETADPAADDPEPVEGTADVASSSETNPVDQKDLAESLPKEHEPDLPVPIMDLSLTDLDFDASD